MKRSNDRITDMVLKYIDIDYLESCIEDYKNREYYDFKNIKNNLDDIYQDITNEEIDLIRYYTGVSYREINAVLRNNWNYETNGILTEEKLTEYKKIASNISDAISRTKSLNNDIKVYRGVSLDAFKRYGINSLDELLSLKGEYYYEQAFTSTSLEKDASFFDRPLEWHSQCNIEITYLVPKESEDGIPLLTNQTSYSKNQSEFLINSGSLSKIIDVNLSEDKTKAYIIMALIPKKVWDRTIEKNNTNKVIK